MSYLLHSDEAQEVSGSGIAPVEGLSLPRRDESRSGKSTHPFRCSTVLSRTVSALRYTFSKNITRCQQHARISTAGEGSSRRFIVLIAKRTRREAAGRASRL